MASVADMRVVAIGGGTGLPMVLRACRLLNLEPSAVVTMADDGGSSGRLRRDLGIVPPGDVRNCLAALADDSETGLAELFGYRFSDGDGLAGHALGNLILAALTDITGSFEGAVELVARHLKIRGEVLPSTYENVVLTGIDLHGNSISGQANIANNQVAIDRVELLPRSPQANPRAVQAIREADTVLIGPGSLYTSIIPNILVPDILAAIRESNARVVYLCNVANGRGETSGFDACDHVGALVRHGLDGAIDVAVLANGELCAGGAAGGCAATVASLGIEVHCADLASDEHPLRHDLTKLTATLSRVLGVAS